MSRANARMSSAATPQCSATASGEKLLARSRTCSTPMTCSARSPRSTRSSSNNTCTTANNSAASVPGRGAMWRSASSAVRVRAGSMTVSVPPRLRRALSLPGKSAAVARLPLETRGFAPMITKWSVWSRSGTVNAMGLPNIRPSDTCLGIWSSVLAENTWRVPSARMINGTYRLPAIVCAFGFPTYTPTDVPPVSCTTPPRPSGHRLERLVPRCFGQHTVTTDHRLCQPVGIVVQLGEARAFRADESGAEHVIPVTACPGDPTVLDRQRQAASGLAERADPQRGPGHVASLSRETEFQQASSRTFAAGIPFRVSTPRTPWGRACRCRAGRGSARRSRGRSRRRTRWGCRSPRR